MLQLQEMLNEYRGASMLLRENTKEINIDKKEVYKHYPAHEIHR